MKTKLVFLAALITLIACSAPDTQVPPSLRPQPPQPPTATATLYRGDWAWAAVNVNNSNDYITGVASFSTEITNDQSSSTQFGKKIAAGLYDVTGIDTKPVGGALMGPIATPLDAGFVLTGKVLLVAVDSDGAMGTSQSGQPLFSGPGRIYNANSEYINIGVAFIKGNDNPTYLGSQRSVNIASFGLEAVNLRPRGQYLAPSATTTKSLQFSEQLAIEQRPSSGTGALNDLLK